MGALRFSLNPDIRKHVGYAAWFCDPRMTDVTHVGDELVVEFDGDDEANIRRKMERLIARFASLDVFESRIMFQSATPLMNMDQHGDVYQTLLARKEVIELGRGQVAIRGLPYELLEFFDASFVQAVAVPAQARSEYYPGVMEAHRLDRTNHFSSFPEHVHFVMHLREDLDVLDQFSEELKASGGWSPSLLAKLGTPLAPAHIAVNPAVCYHCYASLENTALDTAGFAVTARSRCHRYEGGNHRGMVRLLDFSMREVIFVGAPDFVRSARQAAVDRIAALVNLWGLHAWLETANDPFFANDFAVKATMQRKNDMKHELCMPLPGGGKVAVSSSNFHSTTFGKAFGISRNARPACTGCVGFGLERWTYAVLCQIGLNIDKWPASLRSAFQRWQERQPLG
jgi:hypothetical protein